MSENPKREGAPRLLTVPEIVEKHGISRQTIHAYRQRGTFPQPAPEQGGSTRLRFREDEVDAFIAANPKRPGRRPRTDRESAPQGGPMPAQSAQEIEVLKPPIGSYVVQVFRIDGYDPDVGETPETATMARLAAVDANGEATGWEPNCVGLYDTTARVIDHPRDALTPPAVGEQS